jgi:cobalamin biosynthesis protein CobT
MGRKNNNKKDKEKNEKKRKKKESDSNDTDSEEKIEKKKKSCRFTSQMDNLLISTYSYYNGNWDLIVEDKKIKKLNKSRQQV